MKLNESSLSTLSKESRAQYSEQVIIVSWGSSNWYLALIATASIATASVATASVATASIATATIATAIRVALTHIYKSENSGLF